MEKKNIVVPEGMLKAAGEGSNGLDPCGFYLVGPLRQALVWLDNKLHESNVEFYKATVVAERERFPEDSNLAHISSRVNFEYGASFARNYIRGLWTKPELEKNEAKGFDWTLTDIIQHIRLGDYDNREACARIKSLFDEEPAETAKKIPEEIKDMLLDESDPHADFSRPTRGFHNSQLIEAFTRGVNAGVLSAYSAIAKVIGKMKL